MTSPETDNLEVIARDLNVNAMYGEDLRSKYPAVALALAVVGVGLAVAAANRTEDPRTESRDPRASAGNIGDEALSGPPAAVWFAVVVSHAFPSKNNFT